MLLVLSRGARCIVGLALLTLAVHAYDGQPEDHDDRGSPTPSDVDECEARTINYITHTLPQLCPTSTWRSDANGTSDDGSVGATPTTAPSLGYNTTSEPPTSTTDPTLSTASTSDSVESESTTTTDPEGAASPFMSFEDWKEMMLQQTGQDPQEFRSRKTTSGQGLPRDPPDMGHYGLGEEDEISLDFEKYLNQDKADRSSTVSSSTDETGGDQPSDPIQDGERPFLHRSKDAGKTCKERFSYSSFDAGATILKTGRNTKNAKAILVENKDTYMLLECSVDSKYVIVELSDDVLIDTIVLANFEFFSSMIRHFRVSVSDRYPVKIDRWRDIGTFEARNSRDVQAFLVENPQIWAKYVRVEFLTHYGKEFYCPVSLLRIHGSRLLDSWKDTETLREEELQIEAEDPALDSDSGSRELEGPDSEPAGTSLDLGEPRYNFTLWEASPTSLFSRVCLPGRPEAGSQQDETFGPRQNTTLAEEQAQDRVSKEGGGNEASAPPTQRNQTISAQTKQPKPASTTTPTPPNTPVSNRPSTETNSVSENSTVSADTPGNHTTPTTRPSSTAQPGAKHRSPGTGSASTTPPVQEGFFNAITKRLQQVESNLTLSLQYLEDHSRYMQEAFHQGEQKKLSKVTTFLDTLNQTVMAEMRGMRDQYDQIWQSTVFALESQKKQTDRDIVALSSRLNLLADEVVFQKRMAIVQAVLLLCCLSLVIFSRGVPIPYLAPLIDQNGTVPGYSGPAPSSQHGGGILTSGSGRGPLSSDSVSSHPLDDQKSAMPTQDAASTRDYERDMPMTCPGERRVPPSNSDDDGLSTTAQISPPRTPVLEAADSPLGDHPANGFDMQATASRRLQAYVQSQARKPLPALPEYPSPDSPSSPR